MSNCVLILGGANSGKSRYAEGLAAEAGLARVYIATAQAFDDEMRDKITAHQAGRGDDWQTIEAPLDLVASLDARAEGEIVLIDCVTLWLSNHLLADHDLGDETVRLLEAVQRCAAPVIVVSNEVGLGVVPDTPLGRQFRSAQGRLNQDLAAMAGRVVQVIAGLPQVLKDEMP